MKFFFKFALLAGGALASLVLISCAGCSSRPNGFPTSDTAQRAAFKADPSKMPASIRGRYQGMLQNTTTQAQQNVAKHYPAKQPAAPAAPTL